MGLIICIGCQHQVNVTPVKRRRYKCNNCGCVEVIIIRRPKIWMEIADKAGLPVEEATHLVYAGLKWEAERRGYKPKWVDMKFLRLFGRKPNGEAVEGPQPPSQHLVKWFGKERAAYAKERRKLDEVRSGGAKKGTDFNANAAEPDRRYWSGFEGWVD